MAQNSNKFSTRNYCRLLRRLNSAELNDLEVFLRMPSLKLHKTHHSLFKLLKNAWPDFKVSKVQVMLKIFPADQNHSDNALNKTLWQLHRQTEKWLLLDNKSKSLEEQNFQLAEAYAKRNLSDLFLKINAIGKPPTEESKQEDIDTFYYRGKLYEQLYYHPDTSKLESDISSFDQISRHLDYHYYAAKLPLVAEQLSRKNFVKDESVISQQETCITFAKENQDVPYFYFYHQLIELIRNHNHAALEGLIKTFENQKAVFSLRGQMRFFNLLLNHVIRLVNSGQKTYQSIQFKLYQFGLDHNLILINGRITFLSYNNIFAVACLLKKFSFAESFLKSYYPFLEPAIKKDAYGLLWASYLFQKEKFEKAIEHLRDIVFNRLEFKLVGKTLELRCFYELYIQKNKKRTFLLNQSFLLEKAAAFQKFVKNNKQLSIPKKDSYFNFIKIYRTIVKTKAKPRSIIFKRKTEYKTMVNNPDFVLSSKNWLAEKINEL